MGSDHVHHVLLLGDQKLGLRWLPWAKNKLKTLQIYDPGFDGQSFGERRYAHTIGTGGFVVIGIKMVKEQKWIMIWATSAPELYMESGILDHRNVAPLNEDTHLPSINHYSNAIKAIRGEGAELGELKVKELEPLKLDGENRGEGDSKSIGCTKDEKEKEIVVSSPLGAKVFTSDFPRFCEDLRDRKFTQQQMPASLWSGKLRLMIQSIYGSKREDYEMDELFGNFSPLTLDGEGISYNFNGGAGLFSGRNYEYFMVKVQTSGIYAKALEPSPAGEKLRDYLNDNPGIPAARKKRYEAYLLSTLTFKGSWVRIGEVNDIFAHGGTFGYGFAWNWSGDTAYAAVHNLKDGETNVWEACLMRVAVAERTAETLAEGRLTAVGVLEEGPTEFTFSVASDLIWTPDFLLGGMNLFVSQGGAFDGPTHVDSDVPIHAMTNYENDTFDLVRFKREDKGTGDGAFGENNVSGFGDIKAIVGCGDSACDMFSTTSGSVVEKGFYVTRIGGAKYEFFESVSESGNGVNAGAAEAFRGNILNDHSIQDTNVGLSADCDPTPGNAVNADEMNTEASGGSLDVDGNFSGKYLLLIPFYDCDAVYMGSLWEFDGEVSTRKTTDGSFATNAIYWYDDPDPLIKQFISAGKEGFQWSGNARSSKNVVEANDPDFFKKAIQVDTVFSMLRLEYFFNGAFVGVHEDDKVEDEDVADAMYMPDCFGAFPFDEPPEWETGSTDYGGYSVHWNPNPIFPTPVKAPSVFSRTSGIDHSYKITKDPGDTWLDDGDYNYDQIDDVIFSYVGFA